MKMSFVMDHKKKSYASLNTMAIDEKLIVKCLIIFTRNQTMS